MFETPYCVLVCSTSVWVSETQETQETSILQDLSHFCPKCSLPLWAEMLKWLKTPANLFTDYSSLQKITGHPCLGTIARQILILFSVHKDITKCSWSPKIGNIWMKSEQEIRPKPHQSIWEFWDIFFSDLPIWGRCRYIYFKLRTT